MELRRSRLEHPEAQELAGHNSLLSVRTLASAVDSNQHFLPERVLRELPPHCVVLSHLGCVVAAKISSRSISRHPQPCTDRIAVFPAISSTARHNTASRAPC